MNAKKEFKIVSILFLIFGGFDLIDLARQCIGTDLFKSESLFVIIAVLAVTLLLAFAELYMGIMGLKYCNGTGKGKFHIVLAKIGLFFLILGAIDSVFTAIGSFGVAALLDLLSSAVALFLVCWYMKLARNTLRLSNRKFFKGF